MFAEQSSIKDVNSMFQTKFDVQNDLKFLRYKSVIHNYRQSTMGTNRADPVRSGYPVNKELGSKMNLSLSTVNCEEMKQMDPF